MNKYVCSLCLAKRLKELGVKQESEFYWANHKEIKRIKNKLKMIDMGMQLCVKQEFIDTEHYSAFTVGELGEMLPFSLWYKNDWRYIREYHDTHDRDLWHIYYNTMFHQEADTEANARAKMLIDLIENKLTED